MDRSALIDTLPAIVWTGDPSTGRFDFVSKTAHRILGYTAREWLEEGFWVKHLHPEDREWAPRLHADLFSRGRAYSIEYRMISAAGQITWFLDSVTPDPSSGGKPACCGVMLDVTERHRAEDRRRKHAARLHRFDAALAGLTRTGILEGRDFSAAVHAITEMAANVLDVERVSVWRFERDRIQCIDLFERAPGRHSEGTELHARDYPEYFRALATARTLAASDVYQDPRTRAFKERYLAPLGITSLLDAPVLSRGRLKGIVCHEHVGPRRRWGLDEQQFAGSVADMVSIALAARENTRAQDALVTSNRALRLLISVAPLAIVVIDAAKRVQVWNPAAERMFGWAATDIVDEPLPMIPVSNREAFEANFARVLAGEEITGLEIAPQRRDSALVTVSLSAAPIRDENGAVTSIIAMYEDISHRKRAEEEQRQSEERLKTVIRGAPVALFVVDADARFTIVDGCAVPKLGLTPAEFVGSTVLQVAKGSPAIAEGARLVLAGAEIVRASVQNGRDVETRWSPLRAPSGASAGAIGIAMDITERRSAERRLEILAEVSLTIAKSGRDVPAMIVGVRTALSSRMGATCAFRLLADPPWSEPDAGPRCIEVNLRTRRRRLGQLRVTLKDPGHTFADADRILITEIADRIALSIENARLFHATRLARQQAERARSELRALNETLERRVAGRTKELEVVVRDLEAISYSVSHDLRTSLRGISGLAGLVLEEHRARLGAVGCARLERVQEAVRRTGMLIDELLRVAWSAGLEVNHQEVDLTVMARDVIDALQEGDSERTVEFVADDGVVVQGDPQLLRVVMENLLGNAWKFTSTKRSARIEFGVDRTNPGEPVYFVRDNGVGFDPRFASSLFSPLVRLHAPTEFEGTGIGLATVHRIIERHGGRVWAEGAEGAGATFHFTLAGPAAQ